MVRSSRPAACIATLPATVAARGWDNAPPCTVAAFGASGDVPFLERADADARADLIAYRPSDHIWRIAFASSAF